MNRKNIWKSMKVLVVMTFFILGVQISNGGLHYVSSADAAETTVAAHIKAGDELVADPKKVEKLEKAISEKIEDIGSSLGWAEDKAGDAANTIETVRSHVLSLERETKKHEQRIKAVIRKVEADDPIKQKVEEETFNRLIQELKKDPTLLDAAKEGKPLSVSLSGEATEELDEEDLKRLFANAVEKVLAETSKL